MNKKIVAVVQVRMGSSRLPGKVLKEIHGTPLLKTLITRLGRSKRVDEIIIATSINKENDQIQDFCRENNYLCFRGSEEDVLGRILEALESRQADIGVEIFGDCPLVDPEIVDSIIDQFLSLKNYDFVGNDLKTSYPPGMEVEVFDVNALKDASDSTNDPKIREHGTLFIRMNPKLYKLKNIQAPPEYNYPEIELELDNKEDLILMNHIISHFYPKDDFSLKDILKFLEENKELKSINSDVPRRWKEYRDE